ncbi:ATP-binding cassette domain-containing protein [Rhizohabitans arisaemae]|uniref:ATP-binding cassette domain-containing protein n=1 Tax=Rhizohabitans arisaemae TaxID=2720610 RepID=UPI0024B1CED1|nr:ATP-binding cassette domain-containing protein [Rhizohabitans arisaemae]
MSAIEARELVKTYGTRVQALAGVTFTAAAGSVCALLGRGGAGKSTTVKILTTLISPDSGEASVAGFDIRRAPDQVRHVIGVVRQAVGDGRRTARENLLKQGAGYGLRGALLTARVDELLERFSLTEEANRPVRGYSRALRCRLDIAMQLVHRPDVLFLDEPSAGLDRAARYGLWAELTGLTRDHGLTILFATGEREEAELNAHRVVIVDRGRIVASGALQELTGSLRGDAIHIRLTQPARNGEIRRALEELSEVAEVVVNGRVLYAHVDDGVRDAPVVASALEAEGLTVAAITVGRPSLDDVHFRRTGRQLY